MFEQSEKALDALQRRLDIMIDAPTGQSTDSIEQIATELASIYRGTLVTETQLDKQIALFIKLKTHAQTAGDFYTLDLVVRRDPFLLGDDARQYLQKAAAQGYPPAMADFASNALAGVYKPLDESLRWGLRALRYLEGNYVPMMEIEEPHSKQLALVKHRLQYIRQERQEILPEVIPVEPQDFAGLVAKTLAYRQKRGASMGFPCVLTMDAFSQLKPAEDLEVQQLNALLRGFSIKITAERGRAKLSKVALSEATELHKQLATALYVYAQSKQEAEQSLEQAKTRFLKTCTDAISHSKPLLQKELGWGAYLANLFKSIANIVVHAANATIGMVYGDKNKFTLFAHEKGPMVAETEQLEQAIQKTTNPGA